MSKLATTISASKGLFIKLGRSGNWEKECLENGILRFGYKETPFDAAISGEWETVRKIWIKRRKDEGTDCYGRHSSLLVQTALTDDTVP